MSQSQNKLILADLMQGKRITCLEAWINYGCGALHSRAADIRKIVPLQDEWITVTGKDGVIKRVKQYFLDPTYIEQAKTARA